MLTLPAIASYEDATVYPDDHQINKFYVVPNFPSVRHDKNDNPVFLLVKYKFSDESREENPNLPRGGGYLAFDSALTISDERKEEIKVDLEEIVEDAWQKLKDLPDDTLRTIRMGAAFVDNVGSHWGNNGMSGSPLATGIGTDEDGNTTSTTRTSTRLTFPGTGFTPPPADQPAPPVILADPLWKEGTVRMLAPQAEGLISHRLAEAPASLVGTNVASFNADLTTDGAEFFQAIFLEEDGSGGSDLAAVQVVYELTMLAKVPPATARIKLNTASTYHALQELFHERDNCSDDYFTSENMMTQAMQAGLVQVQIDAGGVTDEDIMEMLMQQTLSAARELMVERFASKERPDLEEWGDDVATSSDEVYRLKTISEVEMVDLEQTIELSPTIEYKIAPQGMMSSFFGRFSASEMRRFVRIADLNSDFFKTLDLRARAFANWDTDDIAFVELEVQYGSGSDMKTQSFTFTAQDNEPKGWNPGLDDEGNREYQYRYRIAFNGREPGDFTRFQPSTARDLNVVVPTPGKLSLEISGAAQDFENIVSAVLVHLRYKDIGEDIELEHSVLLADGRLSDTWEQLLYADWDKDIEFKYEYLLKSGKVVSTEWASSEGQVRNLIVPVPNVDKLDVTLIPSGHWDDVVQSVVTVKYSDDANSYHQDGTFNLKTIEEFKKWSVLLVDSSRRKVDYEILTTFRDGNRESTQDSREGDGPIAVIAKGPPKLRVRVAAAVIDFELTPLVKVEMSYRAPSWPAAKTHAITLTGPDAVEAWVLDIPEGAPTTYTYQITYFPAEGDPVEREPQVGDDPEIVVPRYTIPRVGGDFLSTMIDFAVTPVVQVDLSYDDPQRDVHEVGALIFAEGEAPKQSWLIPVADDAPREYSVQITYHLADGEPVTLDPVTTSKRALVLPAYRPPEG